MSTIQKKKILIIDDDLLFCSAASDYLSDLPVEILSANSGMEGLTLCSNNQIDVVLLDQKLPDIAGTELYPSLLEKNEQTKIIFITAFPDLKLAVNAVKDGAYDYLSKPFEPAELSLAVDKALKTIHLEKLEQLHQYHQQVETDNTNLVGSSEVMQHLRHMIDIAAVSEAPVIVTGETGTGKNMVSKAIHYSGPKKNEPYITVNCAALPENLIEAELFGVERGAYTGADKSRKGLFELAEGGTLLLDEIGELPLNIQSKLLGVLDEKTIKKVGGENKIDVNVRVIAATNVEIEEAVSKKSFREDLYYRLSIIRIHIRPLRERYTDIPEIINHQIKTLAGKKGLTMGAGEYEKLSDYYWPGNIRELSNLVERAIILRSGEAIFPSQFIREKTEQPAPLSQVKTTDEPKTLEVVEKQHIFTILNSMDTNYTKTAKVLGISRSTLMRKLEKYNS